MGILRVKIYCFDIDGTLCSQVNGNYAQAEPYSDRVSSVNALFHAGNRIVLFTARGSKSGIDWVEATRVQIEKWGLRYHELVFGKPHADFYIDDKAIHPDDFDW